MNPLDAAIQLENPLLHVVILPALGGKIASLRIKRLGLELLQQPLQPYRARTREQSFDDSDASGSDDCMPSVSDCKFAWNGRSYNVPDHGDVWRLHCISTNSQNSVNLKVDLFSVPLSLERQITLLDNSLQFRYRLTNASAFPVPYLWSAHPLFAVDAGDRIALPNEIHRLTLGSSMRNRLGNSGDLIEWPITGSHESRTRPIDLSLALGPETDSGDKLFAELTYQSASESAWCGLYREQHKVGVSLAFLRKQLPSLGLWLCYGGWPQGRKVRQQCVALEPCTCSTDSLERAVAANICPILNAGCSAEWMLTWFIHGATQPVSFQEFEIAPQKAEPARA